MASKKQIYTIFSCDGWVSKDSMRLMMVTTSVRRLKSFIAKQIEGKVFEYCDNSLSPKEQAALFRQDFWTREPLSFSTALPRYRLPAGNLSVLKLTTPDDGLLVTGRNAPSNSKRRLSL